MDDALFLVPQAMVDLAAQLEQLRHTVLDEIQTHLQIMETAIEQGTDPLPHLQDSLRDYLPLIRQRSLDHLDAYTSMIEQLRSIANTFQTAQTTFLQSKNSH